MLAKKKNRVIISILLATVFFVVALLPFIGGLTYCRGKSFLGGECFARQGIDIYWYASENFLSNLLIDYTDTLGGIPSEKAFEFGFIFAILAGFIFYLILTLVARHWFKNHDEQ